MVCHAEEITGARRSEYREAGGTAVETQPLPAKDDYEYPFGAGRYGRRYFEYGAAGYHFPEAG